MSLNGQHSNGLPGPLAKVTPGVATQASVEQAQPPAGLGHASHPVGYSVPAA